MIALKDQLCLRISNYLTMLNKKLISEQAREKEVSLHEADFFQWLDIY